ncbi:MAG: oligosaccharide flippase family protein, partial [Candidatus Kapabacteria bacterium]|nr:oligosaccharide flippase family protein [Candidatus Kapabacteria bacterium]MDW7996962.1 oligosaccharide flippase family protein [Bacteroidota bacterium]
SLVGIPLCWPWLRFGWHGRTRLREILRFTLPQTLASSLHTGMRQLDVYLVQYFFGVAVVGLYQAAKTFYRLFDTAFDLIAGLLYPAAVRLLSAGAEEELRTLLAKTLSVTFLGIVVIVALIEVGGADIVLTPLLVTEYEPAILYFKLFALGALGIPFAVLGPAILAIGRSRRMLFHIALATLVGTTTLVVIGLSSTAVITPLGMVAYTLVLGLLNFGFVQRRFRIPWPELFRSLGDFRGFVQSLRSQQRAA